MIFGVFLETYVKLLKSITSQFFQDIATALSEKTGHVGAAKLYVPNTTL